VNRNKSIALHGPTWVSHYYVAQLRDLWRRFAWIIRSRNFPRTADGRLLLHIGCGDINAPGFINIDARYQPHIHIVTSNLQSLDMVPDETADMVYMCHVLEHVSHCELITTVREIRRVLKRGGVYRVSVPDFDKIVSIYHNTGNDVTAVERPLMGGQDYSFNYHYSVFNYRSLESLMLKNGFMDVRVWDPLNCHYHDFNDWASQYIVWEGKEFPISLNLEAIKE